MLSGILATIHPTSSFVTFRTELKEHACSSGGVPFLLLQHLMPSVTLPTAQDKNIVRKALPTSVNSVFWSLVSIYFFTHGSLYRKFWRQLWLVFMLPRPIRTDGLIAIYGELLHSARIDPRMTLSLFDLLISRYIDTKRVAGRIYYAWHYPN